MQAYTPPVLEFEPAHPNITASHYLAVVLRQKWRIIAFVAACVLATYVYFSRQTPIYEATTMIDVDQATPSGVVGQEASPAYNFWDSDEFLSTQMELIQSDAVLRPVIQKFNLYQREAELRHIKAADAPKLTNAPVFLSELKVDRPQQTDILRISYRSADPVLAANVANAIAKSYEEHIFDIRLKSANALASFMEKQLDELKAKMENSGQALAKFEQELDIINPEERTSIVSARLLQLNTEYTNAQADRVRKEALYNGIQAGTLASAQVSGQSDELKTLSDRLNVAKQRLADVSTIYGPGHAEYRKAANTVSELQRQFDESRHEVTQRVETEYREAVAREQMLQQAVSQTKGEFDRLNSHSFNYQRLKRDADADKALYSDLEKRIKEATINSGFQSSAIRIADMARPPARPILPRKRMDVVLAFVISLALAICGAILMDVMDTTIRDPEQAARSLDTTVLGALPSVKGFKKLSGSISPSLIGPQGRKRGSVPPGTLGIPDPAEHEENDDQSASASKSKNYPGIGSYEEAIRTLRHSILLPDFDRTVRSLLLTSASPGDGKSTAIIHLAIAHAEQGKRTLIIDADLRRPGVHKRLNLEGLSGLSNVLVGEVKWRDAVSHSLQWPNLDVLPAGQASRRASDLVGSMMVDILDEAAQDYDLILVDAPPLLGFAEAMQIATAVDGVVVVAKAGQTSRKAVATVLATLARLRANVIGVVLNRVSKHDSQGYYYYADYHRYYSDNRPQG
jgi:capsular exopolysaccharide synthesis family protein